MSSVELASVTEEVLAELVRVATQAADADEVTPPLGSATGAWTPARVAWLRDFHEARRAGLDGRSAEQTWAVLRDGSVLGSVRLRRLEEGVGEVGIWLTRGSRGRGVGRAALESVIEQARHLGLREVRADTRSENVAATALLGRLGFRLAAPTTEGAVAARRDL